MYSHTSEQVSHVLERALLQESRENGTSSERLFVTGQASIVH